MLKSAGLWVAYVCCMHCCCFLLRGGIIIYNSSKCLSKKQRVFFFSLVRGNSFKNIPLQPPSVLLCCFPPTCFLINVSSTLTLHPVQANFSPYAYCYPGQVAYPKIFYPVQPNTQVNWQTQYQIWLKCLYFSKSCSCLAEEKHSFSFSVASNIWITVILNLGSV